jgi:hypothetical protein
VTHLTKYREWIIDNTFFGPYIDHFRSFLRGFDIFDAKAGMNLVPASDLFQGIVRIVLDGRVRSIRITG